MTGWDPSAVVSLLQRPRNVRETDLQGPGEFGGGLVPELAGHAVVAGCVLLVADGRGDCGTGGRQCQDDDPDAPTGAASREPGVHESSTRHHSANLAQMVPGPKGRERANLVETRINIPTVVPVMRCWGRPRPEVGFRRIACSGIRYGLRTGRPGQPDGESSTGGAVGRLLELGIGQAGTDEVAVPRGKCVGGGFPDAGRHPRDEDLPAPHSSARSGRRRRFEIRARSLRRRN